MTFLLMSDIRLIVKWFAFVKVISFVFSCSLEIIVIQSNIVIYLAALSWTLSVVY